MLHAQHTHNTHTLHSNRYRANTTSLPQNIMAHTHIIIVQTYVGTTHASIFQLCKVIIIIMIKREV